MSREKGYEINVPDKCPDKLEKAIEVLGNVKYVAWGFPMFFLYKDQGALTKGWSASFRNAAKFTDPSIKCKTPIAACKKNTQIFIKTKKGRKKNMRKSGYYWVKVMNKTGGEEVIAYYVRETEVWVLDSERESVSEDQVLVLSSERLLPPGKDWKLPSDPPQELKAVMVWAQGNKSTGYAIAYVEKGSDGSLKWWEAQATINSSPLTVLFWQELPAKPVS